MEKWDKGIQMFDEAPDHDKDHLARIQQRRIDLARHQAKGEYLLTVTLGTGVGARGAVKALELVKDPETGAYGLPDDKGDPAP